MPTALRVDQCDAEGNFEIVCVDNCQKDSCWYQVIKVPNVDPIQAAIAYLIHWMSYPGNLQIDNGVWYQHDSGQIRFDCYSWGWKHSVNLSEGPFED
jgi:glycosyltransferase involved in cell wall biosynthesis